MSDLPYGRVSTWREARDSCPDQPVVLVLGCGTNNNSYMRYQGEFHRLDDGSYTHSIGRQQRWRIDGVWFNNDSIYWMIDNSVALPFSAEDLMLYQLTWGDCHE